MSKIPTLFLALAALTIAGCNEPVAQPVAPPPSPAPSAGKVVPPIPEATMAKIKSAWDAAGALAKQARELRSKGEEIERTAGREAANDTLAEARKLYREAAVMTEEWIEPDLGPLTQDQIDKFLGSFVAERGRWISESGKMGKLHD